MAHQIQTQDSNGTAGTDRSLGELFAELSRETSTLVRQEVALAKTELTQKATRVGKDVGFLLAGGFVLYAGFLALLAAAILALSHAIPTWASALVIGAIVLVVGGILVAKGIEDLKEADLAPTETLETLKEDTTWAKNQTR